MGPVPDDPPARRGLTIRKHPNSHGRPKPVDNWGKEGTRGAGVRKKAKPIVLKRSEVRKSIRKPPVRPAQRIEDKRKRPQRGPVKDTEING